MQNAEDSAGSTFFIVHLSFRVSCFITLPGPLDALNRDLRDRDVGCRPIARARAGAADALHDIHAVDDLAEHRVPVVEVRRRRERDEELAAVRVWTRIRHREDARLGVAQRRVEFVGELVAGPAGALPERVAALDHEALNHAVEDDAVVERRLLLLARRRMRPLFRALREADEVLDRAWGLFLEQPNGEASFGGIEMRVSPWLHG